MDGWGDDEGGGIPDAGLLTKKADKSFVFH